MITAERPLGRLAPCAMQPVFAWLLILTLPLFGQEPRTTAPRASIAIDAGKPAGTISPLLYGQFLEHMFQCIKVGLHAEMIRNRSFEEAPDGALYAGRMLNVFVRSSDLVAMTSVSDLVNGWSGGIIQANRHWVLVSSIYQVNKHYPGRSSSSGIRAGWPAIPLRNPGALIRFPGQD